jgi:hypothetical protein
MTEQAIMAEVGHLIPEARSILSKEEIREKILLFEDKLKMIPGSMIGDCFPLKHIFVDGAYVREITMPKGALLTSKIHKVTHPYFVLKGEVSVLTEKGIQRIKAPYSGITPAGTKRILYIHEETVWTTVHVTKEKDLEKIEEEVIANSFDDLPELNPPDVQNFIDVISKEEKC